MKEKIISRLKARFPNVNLSKKRLDAIAAKLEKKVEKEEDIDEALDEANELMDFADIAKQDDRVRTLEAETKKKPENPTTPVKEDQSQPNEDDGTPVWARALIDSSKKLEEKISAIESEKTADSRKQRLKEKLKDFPEKLRAKAVKDFSRMQFEKEEDFEAYLEETAADLGEFSQQNAASSFASLGSPVVGTGGVRANGAALKKGIEEWAKQSEPAKTS